MNVFVRSARIRSCRPWDFPMLAVMATLVILSATVWLAGCGPSEAEKPDLIVLHSGRLRGNVVPLELQANAPLQHYPVLAGAIRDVREEAAQIGAEVLLVDLGDSLSGSFASHATGSENMVAFFNALGYDAIALSNLDFAVGPETLSQLKAKVLNPFADASGNPATEGSSLSTTFVKGEIPVMLIANFYGDTDSTEFPDRFPAGFGTSEEDVVPFRDYESLSDDGASNGGISLLTWMKFESPDEVSPEFLAVLDGLGIDAVLAHRIYGGSQREAWEEGGIIPLDPPVSLNILRNNGGFALARLDLKREGDSWKVLGQRLLPMTANTATPDEATVQTISAFSPTIAAADAQLADLASPMDQDRILKSYMASLASLPGSNAVLYSKQSIRTDWPAGPLTASRVFNSLPWTTPLVQIQMTRNQFDEAIESLGMEGILREGLAEDKPLTVVTSEFFARLIARRLEISDATLNAVQVAPSEFDFFVEAIAENPSLLAGGVPVWFQAGNSESPTEDGQ